MTYPISEIEGMSAFSASKLKSLGWQARTPLPEGLRRAYAAFVELMADQEKRAAA